MLILHCISIVLLIESCLLCLFKYILHKSFTRVGVERGQYLSLFIQPLRLCLSICCRAIEGLGIQAIPTLFLFRDGKAVDKVVGVQSKQALKAMIDRNR